LESNLVHETVFNKNRYVMLIHAINV
jgi:hypothetical protein